MLKMATYKDIQEWVKEEYGFSIKTCWIADMKEECGLKPKKASNRKEEKRQYPCPSDKKDQIKNAFKYFNMISR